MSNQKSTSDISKKRSKWKPPENYIEFFSSSSDEEFKEAHPIGYVFLVILGITVLLLPCLVFAFNLNTDSYWALLGCAGGFIFGIGLFNIVGIIIKQYLGHWVTLISFAVGSIMMLISWFLCK